MAATATGGREWLLLEACSAKDVDRVRALLEAGDVDVNVRGSRGEAPIHKAVSQGEYTIACLLLDAGARCDVTDSNGATPLHQAAHRGFEQLARLLLDAGANPNATTTVGVALENCVNGVTPLHSASHRGYGTVAILLLTAGANPNAATKSGRSSLHNACHNRHSALARALLEAGADPDASDHMNRKPLHLCLRAELGFTEESLRTIKELVAFGGSWDITCDALSTMGKACKEAQALRSCIVSWAQQRERRLPLTEIGLEVVRRGPKAVVSFFQEFEKSSVIYHRRKICVVGPSNAGKTSFIKSVVSRASSLEHPDDRTIGVDQFKLSFAVTEGVKSNVHEITFWDFAGQDEYQVAHSLFYSRRTLYLVCVDLEAFVLAYAQSEITNDTKVERERMMNEFIERSVLKWVRAIFARQPDAEFVFVATKEDLLIYPTFTKELKAFLARKLAEVEGILREMQREVTNQSAARGKHRKADTLTLYAYNKHVRERQIVDQGVRASVSVVRGTSNQESSTVGWRRTFARIATAMIGQRNATDTIPNRVPMTQWTEPLDALGRLSVSTSIRPSRPTLFISCSTVKDVEKARREVEGLIHNSEHSFQMPESYSSVLNAVVTRREAAAKIDSSARIGIVFASLQPTLDMLSRQLRINRRTLRFVLQILHDLGDVLWYEDLGVSLFEQTVILDPMLLIEFVRQVITHTNKVDVLSHTELSQLPFWRDLHDEGRFLAMKQMMLKFQLVHPTQGEMQWDSDLIVPAFWNCKTPAAWLFGYEDLRLVPTGKSHHFVRPKERTRVHWQYMFAHEFPDAFFDHLVVASYSPYKKRTAGPDWIVYAEVGIFACRAMVARDVKTKQRVVQLEAVLAETAGDTEAAALWEAFEILADAIVQVLRRYPGIVFTSTALDLAGNASRLESLFTFRGAVEMKRWMPPTPTWEAYKKSVLEASQE